MLTEGWNANRVTHILGIRPFRSQLLCEQVIGRGLRRRNYVVDAQTGLFGQQLACLTRRLKQSSRGVPWGDSAGATGAATSTAGGKGPRRERRCSSPGPAIRSGRRGCPPPRD